KEAAARDAPEIIDKAREIVTAASPDPTPPTAARYSDAVMSLPGLPCCRSLTCSGSILSYVVRPIAGSPTPPAMANARAGAAFSPGVVIIAVPPAANDADATNI